MTSGGSDGERPPDDPDSPSVPDDSPATGAEAPESDDATARRSEAEGEPNEPPPRSRVREVVETFLVAIFVVLFATTFVVQNSVIPTASMEDTLLIGDYLLVNKLVFAPADANDPMPWLAQRPIRRGDVVVFKFPNDPTIDYIKRVVGLPGDVVEIRAKRVLIDGAPLDEPYKRHKTGLVYPRGPGPEGTRDNFGPVTVPEGSLFVMGDNRDYSADSREWRFVPRDHVMGRAFVVFWSREQRPGTWHARGTARVEQVLQGLKTFYRDTRWSRIGTVIH